MVNNEITETNILPPQPDIQLGLGHAAIMGEKETLHGPTEVQLKLLLASVDLASAITDQYPQTDEQGQLGYAIAGSLAVMLLAQARSFEELDASQIPMIVPTRQVEIPEDASTRLKMFARHLGDFDYVQTDNYKHKKDDVQKIDYKTDPEGYRVGRARYLWKGGTNLDRLSDEARDLMQLSEGHKLFSEAVGSFVDSKAVRLDVNGKEIYIVDPRTILAFKTVHLLESFDTTSKPEKYVADLTILRESLGQVYADEELLQSTHDMLLDYGRRSANGLEVPYHNPGFTAELREFVDRAVALDGDASYLEQLQFGQERAVGILKILHQYETPEAKQKIVEFINNHREEIDQWEVNTHSERNIDLLAEFVDTNPEIKKTFVEGMSDGDKEDIEASGTAKWLRNSSMSLIGRGTILRMMESHEHLDHQPVTSDYLQILMHLDEAELTNQLHAVEQIIDKGIGKERDVRSLLQAEVMQVEGVKDSVMSGLVYAVENFDDETLTAFFKAVDEAASRWTKAGGKMIKLNERPGLIKTALDDFGVPTKE